VLEVLLEMEHLAKVLLPAVHLEVLVQLRLEELEVQEAQIMVLVEDLMEVQVVLEAVLELQGSLEDLVL
jgi:hypothetical protein